MSWLEGGGWGPLGDLRLLFPLTSEAARESPCVGLNFTKSTEDPNCTWAPEGEGAMASAQNSGPRGKKRQEVIDL